MMRSRFSAFALRELGYLWKTLHSSHPDRSRPEDEFIREGRPGVAAQRYTGLWILGARDAGPDGLAQVLFFARIFHKGRDNSFVELSDFTQEEGGWRYVSGVLRRPSELPCRPEQLTFEQFQALQPPEG